MNRLQYQPLYWTIIHLAHFSLASCVLGSVMGPGKGLRIRQTSLPLWSFKSSGTGPKPLGNMQECLLPTAMSALKKNEGGSIQFRGKGDCMVGKGLIVDRGSGGSALRRGLLS